MKWHGGMWCGSRLLALNGMWKCIAVAGAPMALALRALSGKTGGMVFGLQVPSPIIGQFHSDVCKRCGSAERSGVTSTIAADRNKAQSTRSSA